jgi:hypothetical protein
MVPKIRICAQANSMGSDASAGVLTAEIAQKRRSGVLPVGQRFSVHFDANSFVNVR